MKRSTIYISATALAAVSFGAILLRPHGQVSASNPADAPAKVSSGDGVVSAAGRVEPVSETVKIGSELSGKLAQVLVDEGAHVKRAQTLAVLNSADYAARVASRRAEIAMRQAELDRVINGSRQQERAESQASVREAEAVMANARAERDRRASLFQTGDISRSDYERTEREYNVAKARYEASRQRSSFVDADARTEDRARAQAALDLARSELAEAEAYLAKTVIRSPLDGVILRRYQRAGETVSDKPDNPIFAMADDSVLRVRVEVDETDVAHLAVGQKAWVRADAFGSQKYWGRVVRVGEELGRKRVRTDEPAERVDTKILETLVELDGHPPLPVGLRVDSFIQTGAGK